MRVVDALKAMRGVTDVNVESDSQPITVAVRFNSRRTNAKRIGSVAKRALETDPNNRAPVKVVYERG